MESNADHDALLQKYRAGEMNLEQGQGQSVCVRQAIRPLRIGFRLHAVKTSRRAKRQHFQQRFLILREAPLPEIA
ncbi:MAG: hypothetical protein ACRD22_01150 [Terriglobia bacterium]